MPTPIPTASTTIDYSLGSYAHVVLGMPYSDTTIDIINVPQEATTPADLTVIYTNKTRYTISGPLWIPTVTMDAPSPTILPGNTVVYKLYSVDAGASWTGSLINSDTSGVAWTNQANTFNFPTTFNGIVTYYPRQVANVSGIVTVPPLTNNVVLDLVGDIEFRGCDAGFPDGTIVTAIMTNFTSTPKQVWFTYGTLLKTGETNPVTLDPWCVLQARMNVQTMMGGPTFLTEVSQFDGTGWF